MRLEVGEQAGDRFVGFLAALGVILIEVGVGVPTAAAAGIQFDETDSALHQAARQQAVGSELRGDRVVHAVQLARGFGFAAEVHRFGRRGLHAVRQFVRI